MKSKSTTFSPPTEDEKELQQIVRRLVLQYGMQSSSYLSLMRDKKWYVNDQQTCVIAYAEAFGYVVTLGDSIGFDADISTTISEFCALMQSEKKRVVFFNVSDRYLALFSVLGFRHVQSGQDAVIHPLQFSLVGPRIAEIRHCVHRMQREKVYFRWYALDAIPHAVQLQIKSLYRSWMAKKKLAKMGFSLGFYPFPIEPKGYVQCAFSATKKLWGVVSFLPYLDGKGMSVELMLRALEAPNGLIEAAFAESIRYFAEMNMQELSLGGTPLASTQESKKGMLNSFFASLFTHSTKLYNFRSLYAFKEKFDPTWKPLYVVFPNRRTLAHSLLAIVQVHVSMKTATVQVLRSLIKTKSKVV